MRETTVQLWLAQDHDGCMLPKQPVQALSLQGLGYLSSRMKQLPWLRARMHAL